MCAQDIYILEAMVMVTTMGQAAGNGGTRCQFYVNCSILYVDGLTRMLDALCIDTHMSIDSGACLTLFGHMFRLVQILQ